MPAFHFSGKFGFCARLRRWLRRWHSRLCQHQREAFGEFRNDRDRLNDVSAALRRRD